MERNVPTPLSKYGFYLGPAYGESVQERYGNLIEKQVSNYTSLLDSMNKALDEVKVNRGLNPIGKSERQRAIKYETAKKILEVSEKLVSGMERNLKEAEKKLPTKLPQPEIGDVHSMTLAFMKRQEIRNILRGMTELERKAIVVTAGEKKDADLLLAVQEAPKSMRLVDEDTLKTATQRWLELSYPQEFETYSSAKMAVSMFNQHKHRALQLTGSHDDKIREQLQAAG